MEKIETKVQTMWSWFKGNGNPGAANRLLTIENVINGKEECTMSKTLKEHLKVHDTGSVRRWEMIIGVALIIVSQIVTAIIQAGVQK